VFCVVVAVNWQEILGRMMLLLLLLSLVVYDGSLYAHVALLS
jgi:hypothetical protein